ncbi:hypothetical protein AAU61_18795 [Desulfocarbo indianensis]|nr:hypothetical protein AAU61_18795 [Desulfocarbo indianensis]
MKIWSQLPISMPREVYGGYYDLLMRAYDLFKRSDTQVVIKDVPAGIRDPQLICCYGFRGINEIEIVKCMLQAEQQGFDAIAGACYFDSGVKIASSLLSIPVTAPAEASMHLAGMMGNKFAVVTSEPGFVEEMTHHIPALGFGSAAIDRDPVRPLTLPFDLFIEALMKGNYSPVIDSFLAVARGCLRDGADVIIAGCGLMSPMFSTTGLAEVDGAPVIDPMVASLKMAELMTEYQSKGAAVKTKIGLYNAPGAELLAKGREELLG